MPAYRPPGDAPSPFSARGYSTANVALNKAMPQALRCAVSVPLRGSKLRKASRREAMPKGLYAGRRRTLRDLATDFSLPESAGSPSTPRNKR
ncbi:MAG: hypothetical protein KME40_03030 [Komarekiella atlantica HA4396-MV6]|nr:hypothetical protein [Komarekiella atlantica HA4396-MV6]